MPYEWPTRRPAPNDIFESVLAGPPPRLVPERLVHFACSLACLGIELRFAGARVRIVHRSLRDPTTYSFGEVTRAVASDPDASELAAGGLYCERIFGTTKLYECACGKLKRMKNRYRRCDHCGVEVTNFEARSRRFGHIVLATPIVPRHLRIVVEALLGHDASRLLSALEIDGSAELEAALESCDVRRRLADVDPEDPLRPYVEALGASGIRAVDALLFDQGTADSPRGIFPEACDRVKLQPVRTDYSGAGRAVVDPERATVGAPTWVLDEVLRPIAYGRLEAVGMTATIRECRELLTSDPALRRQITAEIVRSWPVLLTSGDGFVGALVEPIDEPVFRVPPHVAARLGARSGAPIRLHVPLNEAAIAETRGLIDEEPAPGTRAAVGPLAQLGAGERGSLDALVLAALRGERDDLTTPGVAFVFGAMSQDHGP